MPLRNPERTGLFALVLLVIACLLAGGAPPALAQENDPPTLVLTSSQAEYLAGRYCEYLEDPTGELTFAQVSSPEYAARFKAGDRDILNFGLSDSTFWLRLHIHNDAPVATRWRLELARPSMNTVIFYAPTGSKAGYVEKKTGYIYPFSTRDAPSESFVFNLPVTPGADQTIYISVKDKVMELPLRVWQVDALEQRDQATRLLMGLSFGALFIMLIYNLFLTIMLRDLGFLYYSFFQFSLLIFLGSVQGYAPRYLWPAHTAINIFIIPLSIILGLIGILLFAGYFLQLDNQPPRWKITNRLLLFVLALLALSTLWVGARVLTFVFPLGVFILCYVPLLGVRAWMIGYKPARFYLLSWAIFFIVGISVFLERAGLFSSHGWIPEQALQMSCIFIVAFQALALADRFSLYKQETIKAQADLVEQQREALRLKTELAHNLQSARSELEQKVLERTQALTEANQALAREVEERKRAQKEAEFLASVDPLTGLYNRRHFSRMAEQEFQKALRYKHPLSLVIFDIDHFKNVNDSFGHQIGDMALVRVAQIFQQQARASDILARYGGEEFIALLPETNRKEALSAAERLREAIEAGQLHVDGKSVTITISIGVAGMGLPGQKADLESLLREADEALYQAKNAGRNQVVVFD